MNGDNVMGDSMMAQERTGTPTTHKHSYPEIMLSVAIIFTVFMACCLFMNKSPFKKK
jgi:hypothetical protein